MVALQKRKNDWDIFYIFVPLLQCKTVFFHHISAHKWSSEDLKKKVGVLKLWTQQELQASMIQKACDFSLMGTFFP